MDKLRVRVYNVRFGDAILVSVPDRTPNGKTEMRHILIDVGNVLQGTGGEDTVFKPVVENILRVLEDHPLDLYVMTHEHMDHVQGLFYAFQKLNQTIQVRYAWLTASAEGENYYNEHPEAKKKRFEAQKVYQSIAQFLDAASESESTPLALMVKNNNPQSTADCVSHLRKLAENTAYVHREFELQGHHPFQEVRFQIWAPEENTADYYGKFQPMALGVVMGPGPKAKPKLAVPKPPAGVDGGAFYNLVESRSHGYIDNLLTIDRAANNTSVVFCLEWRGWKLLFTGDAEQRSWKMMDKKGLLQPIHFLKVGHHGSHNGTPPPGLLDKILPMSPPDSRRRCAAVSTCEGSYSGVPDKETLEEIRRRCNGELISIGEDDKLYRDIEFEG
jgi:beta-lactamase superfamily II metal-dependent hydrolase